MVRFASLDRIRNKSDCFKRVSQGASRVISPCLATSVVVDPDCLEMDWPGLL